MLLVMWLYPILRGNKALDKARIAATRLADISAISPRTKAAKYSQLRIYSGCLFLTIILFVAFSMANFLAGWFSTPADETVAMGRTLMVYLGLSVALVSPIFYIFQACLERDTKGKMLKTCLWGSLQPLMHFFIFCAVLLYFLPLIELAKLSLGLSNIPSEGVYFFICTSSIYGIFPFAAYLVISILRSSPAFYVYFDKSESFDLVREQQKLLLQQNFSLAMLDDKSDDYIITLSKVAKGSGDLERANEITNYLVERKWELS